VQHGWQLVGQRRQRNFGGFYRCPAALRQQDAEFVQQPSKLVDVHDANPDQLLAYAMQYQHGLLFFRLHSHETHAGTLRGFPDRCGVGCVIMGWSSPSDSELR
jgi:hypothetical protein